MSIDKGDCKFTKDFSSGNPVTPEGINNAVEIMKIGNLFRYGCSSPEGSEVALLEREIAQFTGAKYALGVNSCGSALYIALLSLGVKPSDEVLISAFNFTAVPSAVVHAGCKPVLVECNNDYCIDIEDLKQKISERTKVLILTHMRGHIGNLELISKICEENHALLIEDCAHSLGSTFNGKHTGRFGKVGCFSTQSHKIINSGEGGILITDDDQLIAKAMLYAGSIETSWQKHFYESQYLVELQEYIPNLSLRMSNLTASVLRGQVPYINNWIKEYIKKYNRLVDIFSKNEFIIIPKDDERVRRGPDTIQFSLKGFSPEDIMCFTEVLRRDGVSIRGIGLEGNARYYKSWKYIPDIDKVSLPRTDEILKSACDLRLPKWFTMEDIELIGDLVIKAVQFTLKWRKLNQNSSK